MSENIMGCPLCSRQRYEGYQEGQAALLKHVEKALIDAHNSRPVVIQVNATPEELEALHSTSDTTPKDQICPWCNGEGQRKSTK